MRFLPILLIAACLVSCRGPETAPPPAQIQGPKLVLHFSDGDAGLPLKDIRVEGRWMVMNMGVWETLKIEWISGSGECTLARVSPSWLLMKDPEGKVHRLVLHGPPPSDIVNHGDPSLDPDHDVLSWGGLSWVWKRH